MIVRNELFDRILDEAKKYDAFKVLITSGHVSYRFADGHGPDKGCRLRPPMEIRESDLEQIFAGATWKFYHLQDTYEYEGAQLRLMASNGHEGIAVNIAKAASHAEYAEQQAASRRSRPWWKRIVGALGR